MLFSEIEYLAIKKALNQGKTNLIVAAVYTLTLHSWYQCSDINNCIILGHQCAPSNAQGGTYIMYSTASQGTMPNNFHFSPCSKNVIAVSK